MAAIDLSHIHKRYGDTVVIEDLSLSIDDGEFVVLVGPSGCGKSTLLRMLAGLLAPSDGRIRIDDRDVTRLAPGERDMAMVFQSYALYPHMSVFENIAFPLRVRRLPVAKVKEKVQAVAEMLGLSPLLDRHPKDLSGGQRQRVAMGRAVVREPKAFLFDEPLSNLDAGLRAKMRGEIAALHRRLGTTTIYVTHDQHEAMTLADRLVLLDRGCVSQAGAPLDVYERPNNRFAAEFLGSPPMNFLPVVREAESLTGEGFRLPAGTVPTDAGGDLWLGVRPEALRPTSEGDGSIPAQVEWVERTGSDVFVYCTVGSSPLVVRLDATAPLAVEVGKALRLRPTRVQLFERQSGRAV